MVALVVLLAGSIFAYTFITATLFGSGGEASGVVVPIDLVTSAPSPAGSSTVESLLPPELPKRLQIAALDIDAAIQYVGTTSTGAMGVPSNYTDVGWYRYGTIPGHRGSAVIAGHLDNGLALPGVFKQLGTLEAGDVVTVTTEKDSRIEFVVERVESYPYQSLPLEDIFNRTDAARLVLITCAGNWLRGDRTYDTRLVVYARVRQ